MVKLCKKFRSFPLDSRPDHFMLVFHQVQDLRINATICTEL